MTIVWDNGDSETMSPWDCQAKSPGRKSNTPASQEEEVQLGRYIPTDEDWPGNERPLSNMEVYLSFYFLQFKLFSFTVND